MHEPCGLEETRQALLALYQKSLQLSGMNVDSVGAKPAPAQSLGQGATRQAAAAPGRVQGQVTPPRQPVSASGVRVQNRLGKG
jgi:hypothetical protein